ncbi:CynX/NimT family MFS transporter [Paracoccus siganidrum]|uniref:MFS transporter n=1 Tax=Paracoccus siganidrum TaxID=1276757 RepID=A0A419A7G0_9RHOB|nr:MFS transporter [Paracoccus siganidrum]RJL16457.1 MFS transporter [Paracoccus siganidrum]RMC30169.1 MFS transporter [Paracoccus siganidrum]
MQALSSATAPTTTRWGAVLLIVAAGVVAALQVGKGAIAAPMLRADLGLGLSAIGWLTGVFAILGLVGGIPTGALVARIGGRRVLMAGLVTAALGAAVGAGAGSFAWLLVFRIVEGAGFLLIVVAAPSILEDVADRPHRNLAFALWSCFMPAGMAIAMLAGPMFQGWRAIWWASALMAILVAVAVPALVPSRRRGLGASRGRLGADIAATLRAGGPLALAAIFALYSLMFFALFSFLPILLMERMQVSHQVAGLLSALATAANIIGNLAAGVLLSRGVGRTLLLAGASLVMGLAALGIFLPLLPEVPTFLLCVLFSAVGGLVPAVLLASAPLAAPGAGLVPIVLGLIVQGNNLGQIVGPVAVGGVIQAGGWAWAALIVAVAALLAAAIAAVLGRILKDDGSP